MIDTLPKTDIQIPGELSAEDPWNIPEGYLDDDSAKPDSYLDEGVDEVMVTRGGQELPITKYYRRPTEMPPMVRAEYRTDREDRFGASTDMEQLASDLRPYIDTAHELRRGTEIVDPRTGEALRPIIDISLSGELATEVAEAVSIRRAGRKLAIDRLERFSHEDEIRREIYEASTAGDFQSKAFGNAPLKEEVSWASKNYTLEKQAIENDDQMTSLQKAGALFDLAEVTTASIKNEVTLLREMAERKAEGQITDEDTAYHEGWGLQRTVVDELFDTSQNVKMTLRELVADGGMERWTVGDQLGITNPKGWELGANGSVADLYTDSEESLDRQRLAEARKRLGFEIGTMNPHEEAESKILALAYNMLPSGTYLNHVAPGSVKVLENILIGQGGIAPRSKVNRGFQDAQAGKLNGGLVHMTPHGTVATEYSNPFNYTGIKPNQELTIIHVPIEEVMSKTPYRHSEDAYLHNKLARGGKQGSVQDHYQGVTFNDLASLPEAFKQRFDRLESYNTSGTQEIGIGQGAAHNLSFAASADKATASDYRYEVNGGTKITTTNHEAVLALLEKYPERAEEIVKAVDVVIPPNNGEASEFMSPPKFVPQDGMKVYVPTEQSRWVGFVENDLNRVSHRNEDLLAMDPRLVATHVKGLLSDGFTHSQVLDRINDSGGEVTLDRNYWRQFIDAGIPAEKIVEMAFGADKEYAVRDVISELPLLEGHGVDTDKILQTVIAGFETEGPEDSYMLEGLRYLDRPEIMIKVMEALEGRPADLEWFVYSSVMNGQSVVVTPRQQQIIDKYRQDEAERKANEPELVLRNFSDMFDEVI